jgi:fructose-specific component phosphotransferase system IIB-like protein
LHHILRKGNNDGDVLAKMAAQRDPIPNGVFINDLHAPSIRIKQYPPSGPSASVPGGPSRVLGGPDCFAIEASAAVTAPDRFATQASAAVTAPDCFATEASAAVTAPDSFVTEASAAVTTPDFFATEASVAVTALDFFAMEASVATTGPELYDGGQDFCGRHSSNKP